MKKKITDIVNMQDNYFLSGRTLSINFRLKQLKILKQAINCHTTDILKALNDDLGKPETEAYVSEIAELIDEIDYASKNLKKWMRPKKVRSPLIISPAKSRIFLEPYGKILIIGPWNYPFQLVISPLIGAIAAGNCVVIKPSEVSTETSKLINMIMTKYFAQEFIAVVEGGVEETSLLLGHKFDYIFFTGGINVGKIIMEKAAKHLTPVTLELGGKNPCIVDENADLKKTAYRIIYNKYFNAGQTCVAPDYLAVHKNIKKRFIKTLKEVINEFYGRDIKNNPDYGRIINEKHFDRLINLLDEGDIAVGGNYKLEDLFIAPTIIENINWDSKIMKDEIFGPILPVIEFDNMNDLINRIKNFSKPLALYFFTKNKKLQKKVINTLSSGGMCINDTFAQILNKNLPFGGVGYSGMGAYHRKASFDTFSHHKSVVIKSFKFENKMKYPPYKTPIKILSKIMKIIMN